MLGKRERHGASSHPMYGMWKNMLQRCYNPKHPKFKNWGGRGITVCDRWRNDVWAFIVWAERKGWEPGLELDRKNNDGNYNPWNCRFVTDEEQANNRRWRPAAYSEQGLENIRKAVAKANRRRFKTKAGRKQALKNLRRRYHA